MQRSGPCLFGCTHGEDSIPHYARCVNLALLMKNKLGIHLPTNSTHLDHFLLLEPPFEPSSKAFFARRALGVYAAFMACNRVRKGHATSAADAWTQFFKEGASSHKSLQMASGNFGHMPLPYPPPNPLYCLLLLFSFFHATASLRPVHWAPRLPSLCRARGSVGGPWMRIQYSLCSGQKKCCG